jgi:hypothetical protein
MTSDQTKELSRDAIIARRLRIGALLVGGVGCLLVFALALALWDYLDFPALDSNFHPALRQRTSSFSNFVRGLVLLVLSFSLALTFKAKQYRARSETADRVQDSRQPVVLLRPFQSDATTFSRLQQQEGEYFDQHSLTTLEEDLAEVVRPIGPLVALGRPHEAIPPVGAARIYESNQSWQDRVVDLLKTARLVILVPGTSKALLWETAVAFRELQPRQLLILRVGENSRRTYAVLRRIFEEATGQEFPQRRLLLRVGTALIFDEGWVPRILPVRMARTKRTGHLRSDLEPFFQANGLE